MTRATLVRAATNRLIRGLCAGLLPKGTLPLGGAGPARSGGLQRLLLLIPLRERSDATLLTSGS